MPSVSTVSTTLTIQMPKYSPALPRNSGVWRTGPSTSGGPAEGHAGLLAQLLVRYSRRRFDQLQALVADVEDREVGDDAVDHADAGQRQRAFRQDLRLPGLGGV